MVFHGYLDNVYVLTLHSYIISVFNCYVLADSICFRFKNQQKETSSNPEDLCVDSDDMDNKSEGSVGSYARSVGSSSSNHLEDSHMGELVSRVWILLFI